MLKMLALLRQSFSLLVSIFLLSTLAWADDRRTDKSVLVIMTLNAEFLWDGVAPEEGSSQVTFPWKGSQTEAEEHMMEIADIIIQHNPDIINFVEIENLQALTTFNNNFLTGRGYKPYLINGTDTFTGQDIALLTRIDPDSGAIERTDQAGTSGGVSKAVSKNYFAKLTVDGRKIALIGLHFLARPLDESRRLEREAQADAIRSLGLQLRGQGHQLVIWGDFNDFDGGSDSRDHIDSSPISNVLKMLREMSTASTEDDLVNAASFVPKASRFTSHFDQNGNNSVDPPNELTSIDHILLSKELAEKVDVVQIPHNFNPVEVTDHFPIVVRIKLTQTPTPQPTTGGIRITRLLPNPTGDETQNEQATVKNIGTQAVSLVGWKLRDRAGQVWTLDLLGTLQPGEEKVIKRNGQAMAMNNGGDTIDLIDPMGNVVQSVTYGRIDEEDEIVIP